MRPAPTIAVLLLALTASTGCGRMTSVCTGLTGEWGARCTGQLLIDASSAQEPVFDFVGLGAVAPNEAHVIEVGGDIDCLEGEAFWQVEDLDAADFALSFGEAPEHATEIVAARELEVGATYYAMFRITGADLGGTSTPDGWSGLFRPGEPEWRGDVGEFFAEHCETEVVDGEAG